MEGVRNAVEAMEAMMSEEQVRRAHAIADQEIFAIRLAELRERQGMKQSDMTAFTQTAVSKLEKRKDMKISTLIEYLEELGLGLEIRVYPKDTRGMGKTETLLKV